MKNYFKSLLLLFTFIFTTPTFAQIGFEDVVYLKNGTIIHGIIIEQVINQSVKIETRDKNVFVFKMEEIEKITKEKKASVRGRTTESTGSSDEPYTGYSLGVETQFGPGIDKNNNSEITLGAHVINGVMINSKYSIGAGVGFDFLSGSNSFEVNYNGSTTYDYYRRDYLLMTYYLDLRAFPLKGKVSPLIIFNCGYSAALASNYASGGLMLNAGVGAKLRFTRKFGFNVSLNYKMQKLNYRDNNYNYYLNGTAFTPGSSTLQYTCITLGLSF